MKRPEQAFHQQVAAFIDRAYPEGRVRGEFWSNVDRSKGQNECWPWLGAKRETGYGVVKIPGTRSNDGAHRRAYILASGGSIPSGQVVRHTCDNPPCCNPAHLLLGTQKDNSDDCWSRGRAKPPPPQIGSKHHKAKLNEEAAVQVRSLHKGGASIAQLGEQYGVSTSTIRLVINGKVWRHA